MCLNPKRAQAQIKCKKNFNQNTFYLENNNSEGSFSKIASISSK